MLFRVPRATLGRLGAALVLGILLPALPAWAGEIASAKQMVDQGRYSDAIGGLEQFTSEFPDDPEGWSLLAKCYENVFRVDAENRALERADEATTDRAAMLQTLQHIGDSAMYAKLVADDPSNFENNLLLALAYLVNDKAPAKAKPVLDHMAALGVPDRLAPSYRDAMGLYLMDTQHWDQARQELNSAVHGNISDISLALLHQVDVLEQQAQGAEAAKENSPDARFAQLMAGAQGFIKQNNNVAAVDLIEDALSIKPADASAQSLLTQAKTQGAVELYDQGKQMVDQKDYADAYDKFDKALKFDPTNASASLGLDFARKMLDKQNQPKVIMKRIEVPGSKP